MKVYVVTEPPSIRGIYDTWTECRAAVSGVRGARYQSVASREAAEAMLGGQGVVLPPGRYAFTDGNADGGVGIVLLEAGKPRSVREHRLAVEDVFLDADVPGLDSARAVAEAQSRLRNVLAEMAGLFYVLRHAPIRSQFVVVHDYKGVADWLQGRWKARDPIVAALVAKCHQLIQERRLGVEFRHQPGHQSTWVGRDDYAQWNARADELATQAAKNRQPAIARQAKSK